MLVAWRRLDERDLDRPFGPWLRGIASRLVLAHYRKQQVAPVVMHEAVLNVIDRHFKNYRFSDAVSRRDAGREAGHSVYQYARPLVKVAKRLQSSSG